MSNRSNETNFIIINGKPIEVVESAEELLRQERAKHSGEHFREDMRSFFSDSSGKYLLFLLVLSVLMCLFAWFTDPFRGWFP